MEQLAPSSGLVEKVYHLAQSSLQGVNLGIMWAEF